MFENLSEVRRANSNAGPKGTRRAQFQMRVHEAKSTIVFSAEQFAEMNIADNSLSQFVDDAKGIVFLAVMPGNSGTFAKTNQRGTKGKKYKNQKLVTNLVEHKYDLSDIGLYKLGEEDGKTLYQVTGNGAAIINLPEEPTAAQPAPIAEEAVAEEAVEEKTHVSEEEASFEERAGEPIVEVEEGTDVAEEEAIEDALTGDSNKTSAEELEF